MEQKLIRFAKVHGYLTAAIMMSSGIAMMVFFGSRSRSDSNQNSPLYLLLWAINPVLTTIGTVLEDASWFKPAKRVCIVFSIAGVLMLTVGQTLDSSFPLSAAFVILAVSLYGFYVLHFLEELFNDLEKRKHQGTITITTIVCERQSAAPEQIQQQQQLSEQNQSVSPPPSYEQTVPSVHNSTSKPKEFPTWT